MPILNVEWVDPEDIGRKWMELDGREFLERIGRREIPLAPILSVLDISEGNLGDGWIEFAMRPQPFMLNLAGTVHGGVLATLVDSALTCALVTRLPKGMACTTIDLQMRFFRPAHLSAERLTARAEVLNLGKSLGATQGEVRDAKGRLIVHATSSLVIAPASSLVKERT
ncbi:MAG TPA: PaaI family thioesterase [Candidatus Baltobacteraceae bacterium]|nr:PaaI family thioesterase [Candidatus Baltobacteraceae bacterium]